MSEVVADTKPVVESEGAAESKERDSKLEAAKAKVEASARAIAEMVAKDESSAGQKFLKLGEKCWKYTLQADAAGYSRKDARGMLEAEILLATRIDYSKEIGRAIKVFHTHATLGEGVLGLPLDMVKALSTFVQEDQSTGNWGLNPKYADQVTKLYNKVVNPKGKRMIAKEFRAQLNRIISPSATESGQTGSSSSSPAGETNIRPPHIDPPQGSVTNPGNTAVTVLKALEQAEDVEQAAKVVGQRVDGETLVHMFAGLTEKLLQEEDREQAAADWKFLFEQLEPLFARLHGAFPISRRKAS